MSSEWVGRYCRRCSGRTGLISEVDVKSGFETRVSETKEDEDESMWTEPRGWKRKERPR